MKNLVFVFLLLVVISCDHQTGVVSEENKITDNSSLQQNLLVGWNTWNNPSILSMVNMPEGLNLQILLRKKRGGPYWLKDAYIANAKVNFPEKITPIAHSYDGSYIEMDLIWEGVKAKIKAGHDGDDLVYLYSPSEYPERPHILALETSYLWNKPGYVKNEDGVLTAYSNGKKTQIFATSEALDYKLPVSAPYYAFDCDKEIGFSTRKQRSIEEIKEILSQRFKEHEASREKYGELSEAYNAMQSVNSWNLIYDANNHRAIAPVSRVWNEAWGGYIIFDWDTYFTGIMMALDEKELGYSNCIAITNAITDEGFIPNLETSFDLKSFDRSQPPVGSITCKMIYDKYQEKWFLEEVYDKLLTWNRWWEKERDNEGFLSWGSDPHPRGMDGHNEQGAKWESGLDNSPLFDEAVFNKEKDMFELASVGLMGMYIADCNYLVEIAEVLGKTEDIAEIKGRADKYSTNLQKLWDEESGIYRDKDLQTGKFTNHLAPTNFYPLIAKVPTQEQAERMINEHFFNEEEFYGDWIMPSISRNDPTFPDNVYWRGRIWAPMNYLVYLGLRNYDLPDARKALAEKSLDLILKEWTENRRVYENYNSMTGEGGDVKRSNDFYAWGGLLSFIALMEEGYW